MNNRTEATEVSNFRKIMKSFGWEKSLSGEKSFGGEKSMGRNLWGEICGEKSIDGLSARSDYPPVFGIRIRIRQVSVSV